MPPSAAKAGHWVPKSAREKPPTPTPWRPPKDTSAPRPSSARCTAAPRPVSAAPTSQPPSKPSQVARPSSAGPRPFTHVVSSDKPTSLPAGLPAHSQGCDFHSFTPRLENEESMVPSNGVGWKLKSLEPEEQYRHNPILHHIEVYIRGAHNDVQKAAPEGVPRGRHAEALMSKLATPHRKQRQKGLTEFNDLWIKGPPKGEPTHRAALEQNRQAFHKQLSDFGGYYDMVAKNKGLCPKPFESTRMGGTGGASACLARCPGPRPLSARTRRPHSARAASHGPAPRCIAAGPLSKPG